MFPHVLVATFAPPILPGLGFPSHQDCMVVLYKVSWSWSLCWGIWPGSEVGGLLTSMVLHIFIYMDIKWYKWIYMEYNDTTYSMYTLLIKWGCTPSKESNIVLVWCDCSPYHTLFFWSQDLRETCADAAGRISRLRPDFAFFFQSCAPVRHWKLQWQVSTLIPVSFMFFSSLSGMKISCDVPEMGWSMLKPEDGWRLICINTRLVPVEADCQAHPFQADPLTFGGASLWSVLQWNPVVAITILSKDDADNTVLVLVLLFPRFTTHTRQRKTCFIRTDWRKSSDIYQTSFAPMHVNVEWDGHSKRRLGVS